MPSIRLVPKSRSHRLGWWFLGLAAGSLASVGAVLLFRSALTSRISRILVRGRASETAALEPVPALVALEGVPASEEWMSETESTDPPVVTGELREGTETEPWLESLQLALERDPRELGYGRSAWTAPLLGRYLLDTQGVTIPLPRLRGAIKELGYRWQHTRYVQAHP